MSVHTRIEAAERLVRLPEVLARTGVSRMTIYRKMDRGEFPPSVQIGANSIGWYESDLLRWLAAPMSWRSAA